MPNRLPLGQRCGQNSHLATIVWSTLQGILSPMHLATMPPHYSSHNTFKQQMGNGFLLLAELAWCITPTHFRLITLSLVKIAPFSTTHKKKIFILYEILAFHVLVKESPSFTITSWPCNDFTENLPPFPHFHTYVSASLLNFFMKISLHTAIHWECRKLGNHLLKLSSLS